MSIALFFTFAACILPWIAYFLADWRMTCITISVPLALAVAAPWLVPESARWLVSQGQVEKAIRILGKFERINGTKVPENVYQQFRVRIIFPSLFLTFRGRKRNDIKRHWKRFMLWLFVDVTGNLCPSMQGARSGQDLLRSWFIQESTFAKRYNSPHHYLVSYPHNKSASLLPTDSKAAKLEIF